ncbi:MAG: hypothetical protein FWH29_01635 [Methanobrevibacter sp.]|nr:hypothetical protein [Methanobrevibacter sp.]
MKIKTINTLLVVLIIILSFIVAGYGFFSNENIGEFETFQAINGETVTLYGKGLYYKDSIAMASQARAQDFVTLVFGIPLLIFSLILANKSSIRGKLLLTGTIGYFLYTYVSYSFLTMYNQFFLIYVLLMSLSFFAFLINITSNELKELKNHFNQKFPRKYVGIFNIIIGIGICLLWLGVILPSIEKAPAVLEHYTTLVIQALDLGFIVPAAILSGMLLIKNKSLGYLFAPVIIIKGVTLILAIVMMLIFMAFSGVNISIVETIIFPLFAIILMTNLYLIIKNLNEDKEK